MKPFAVLGLLIAAGLFARADDPYADSVISYAPGTGINTSYETPAVALGAPASAAVITAPAYATTDIVGVGNGGQLAVMFNSPITNDSAHHAGGMDFTIFGNEFFTTTASTVSGIYNHTGLTVWVSQDNVTYYRLAAPYGADDYYPTQGTGDPLMPVNTALSLSSFTGQTTAQALALYNGSAGGASYSLSWAVDAGGDSVTLPSVSYVEIQGTSGFGYVDAISRVETVPEPTGFGLLMAGVSVVHCCRRQRG